MDKKKILFIGTGGTITAKTVNNSWKPGEFNEKELLDFIPEIKDLADIKTIDLLNIDSSNMQPKHWLEIAKTIKDNYPDYDGFVITHGTDTMHYTASALSFLLQDLSKPIVLTGSQVPPHMLGSDSKRNVLDSVRIATETNICEVAIVFNSKILRGNRTKKFREVEFEAFESIGMLPLGVIEHDIRLTGEHFKKENELKYFNKLEEKICILKITPGFNPKIISNLIDLDYKGIILEGFGAGNVPIDENSLVPEIENAVKKGIPIIVSSQCAIGFSWMYLYECGKKALDAGAIPGHDMISETAMTKLMWVLGNYPDYDIEKIKELFLNDVCGEVSNIRTPKEKRIWEYSL
ncbi:MAG: asparaginase [Candidatus Aenigmarchaeota archaeon]|nr:asparaginase [Candidatus Aenigmarchaeota archaeon]